MCVILVNRVGVLCKLARAVIITICQKNKVMSIVNRRSTKRYFDPPPYNSLSVLCEVIVRDFADAQKCEMILTGPAWVKGQTLATTAVRVRITMIRFLLSVFKCVTKLCMIVRKGNMDVPIWMLLEFVIVGVSNWVSGTGFEGGVPTFFFCL